MKINFTVYSLPVAQPRHRATAVFKDGRPAGVRQYIPGEHPIHQFKHEVRQAVMAAMQAAGLEPFTEPMLFEARFLIPRPAWLEVMQGRGVNKIRKWPTGEVRCSKKPDLDNLIKGVKDAMKGIGWRDDSLVCGYGPRTGKWYHALGEQPRCEVSFWPADSASSVPINYNESEPGVPLDYNESMSSVLDHHEEDRR